MIFLVTSSSHVPTSRPHRRAAPQRHPAQRQRPMATATANASAAPATPDKPSRSTSPASPQFKLRPAESAPDAHASGAGPDDAGANTGAQVPPPHQTDANVDAQESLMFMLNAVQQVCLRFRSPGAPFVNMLYNSFTNKASKIKPALDLWGIQSPLSEFDPRIYHKVLTPWPQRRRC